MCNNIHDRVLLFLIINDIAAAKIYNIKYTVNMYLYLYWNLRLIGRYYILNTKVNKKYYGVGI